MMLIFSRHSAARHWLDSVQTMHVYTRLHPGTQNS